MYVAKLKVPTSAELSSAGRPGDGPKPLEPRNDDDPELVPGTEETVLLMARGRCRCVILVIKLKIEIKKKIIDKWCMNTTK